MNGVGATMADWPTLDFEAPLHDAGIQPIAGLDEAGRGALAGPVMAAAVILPLGNSAALERLAGVRDSKLLSPAQRESALEVILDVAVCWATGSASPQEVDSTGLLPATRKAMERALAGLSMVPGHLLIDHLLLPEDERPQTALVKGDQRSLSIAAASVVAKVLRDRRMTDLHSRYPGYAFASNKGYGTQQHRSALQRLGPTPVHRRSYKPVAAALP